MNPTYIETSKYQTRQFLYCNLTLQSQNIANNTSTIYWELRIGSGSPRYSSSRINLTIDGVARYNNGSTPAFGWEWNTNGRLIQSGTFTVTHNSDGTRSMSWSMAAGMEAYAQNVSGSGTITLPRIPRQADLTGADNFNDDGNPSISYNNSAGNSATELVAGIYNTAGSVAYAGYRAVNRTGTLSYTFNLSTAERNNLRNAMPNSNSMTVRFYLRTLIGGTYYYSSIDRTCTLVNGNPTFSNFNHKDTNALTTGITGNDQVLIKGYSSLQVLITSAQRMVANKGASAQNYTAEIDSRSGSANFSTNDVAINLGTIEGAGTKRLNVRAFDSRGNVTLVPRDIIVHDYSEPVINATVSRLNNFENQTTLTVAGNYSRLTIGGTDRNTVTDIQYRYRESGGTWGAWTNLTRTVTTGSFNCTNVVFNLDNNRQFDFEIRVIDRLVTIVREIKLDVGIPPFFISDNKKCVGVNCIPPSNALPGDIYSNGRLVASDSGWIVPTLQSGWVNYDASYTPASYRKIGSMVYLRGMLRNGTLANNSGTTPIFTLPAGFRPSHRCLFSTRCSVSSPAGRTDVFPNGVVQAVEGANSWFSIDGVCFVAEQ